MPLTVILLLVSGVAAADPLPALPTEPKLEISKYPQCQSDWVKGTSPIERWSLATTCIQAIERFNKFYLIRFPKTVKVYSDTLNSISVSLKSSSASAADKAVLLQTIRNQLSKFKSKDNNDDFGDGYTDYYDTYQRYHDDDKSLRRVQGDNSGVSGG